ncbi:ubiquitin-like modifier-activating enzyme ATG7 [Paramacrobiotus metropolitanus]|uniref:ubiquitin-like modifier-activating enzyme ATG7 n=1 Tax=Paramacrobiotus metropolitanus TaxID=2943436 RepID=UPI00244561C4|nr:ubiquitin-like modifier-activating enzyme ATG7 [Paramacrobiotus metropolitanus]
MGEDDQEGRSQRVLQFEPFSSCIDAGFWSVITKKKLEDYGLDESFRKIYGTYTIGSSANLPCLINLDHDATRDQTTFGARWYPVYGKLRIFNTIENFRDADKQMLASDAASDIWQIITSGEALKNPSLLSRFYMLCFLDLKKYIYNYWFLFPALVFPDKWVHEREARRVGSVFSEQELTDISTFVDKLCYQHNAFLISHETPLRLCLLEELPVLLSGSAQITFVVCDASVLPDNPGWTARNVMALLAYHIRRHPSYKHMQILCYRDRFRDGVRDISHSVVFDLRPVFSPKQAAENVAVPNGVGWEKNEKGKLGPRQVDLSGQLDPIKLAEQAVDLNLKLMRWRLVPELDLAKTAAVKCLIVGSGTLGCNVARCLMGWGINNLTFIDNARVSYSNPVRQSLFTFEDCLNGGKIKSQAASDGVKRIFPSMNSVAHQFSIPMPGHPVSEHVRDKTAETIRALESLVDEHDVLFLLMDTRESRWLPTLLGAAKRKIVINAALGFDSYLVMRHGMIHENIPTSDKAVRQRLGCYFCNDVVAPGNSTRDRTLDQQCTVTRPGISMIAAALAVELLVTLLQHPLEAEAPADVASEDSYFPSDADSVLGMVPHQIRGFLSRHKTVLPATYAFDKCTACSDIVIQEYRSRGMEFLFDVFNGPASFLEDLTGLSKLHADSEKAEILDFSDDESITSVPEPVN